MSSNIKILLLEDNPIDSELISNELNKAKFNYSLKRTDNKIGFIDYLEQFKPDVILSDYNLPQFNGLQALEIAKDVCIETPFILVTGNLDEEKAVSCIKLGAWDYILKGKLVRLVPSINGALKLSEEIKEKNKAQDDLKKSEAKYQDLYDNAPDMFLSVDSKTAIIINCNQTLLNELGYSKAEFIGHEIYNFYTKETIVYFKEILFPYFNKTGYLKGAELEVIKKDGTIIDVSLTNSAVYNENREVDHSRSIWRDITEKKKAEQILKKSEEKYRAMLDANQDIVFIKSPDNRITYMNPAAKSKSKNRKSLNYCHEALFNLEKPCQNCKVSHHICTTAQYREITDPNDNTVYLASYFPIKNIDGSDSIMCQYKEITNLRNIENERIRLLNVLEATQNEIYIINQSNNHFEYVNESSVNNTLFSKEELLKMTPFDLLLHFNNKAFNEIIKSIDQKENGKTVFEAKIQRKDKSIYPVEIHLQLIEQKEQKLVLAIIIDITERQKKEELILKLSKGIEQSPASVVITDLKGNIEFINPKFTESSGYSFDEVKGKNPRILKTDYTRSSLHTELWKTIINGGIWQGEFLNKKKNGELFWEDAIIGPIRDKNDKVTHFIGIKQDITSRKRMEEELRAEKESLTKRVDERTSDLSRLNAELSKAVRMKDEFLANMSHELRTPLNAILGLSEALQDEVYGVMNANQHRSLKTIEDSGTHLLTLINDILDIAKVGAGKVELEFFEVSIYSVCQASLSFIKQIALKKNITYTLSIEATTETIMADERRLKQILINLLSNAVKFTPEGASIGLTVKEDQLNDSINFTVWDKGIGISPESMGKLFKPFIQIDSSLSREYAGTGLGLTLVKNLTELHGGSVSVESKPGIGSSFTISLPISTFIIFNKDLINKDANQSNVKIDNLKTTKIYILKEASSELENLVHFINRLGLDFIVKTDDNCLIEQLNHYKPNLILLDIEFLNLGLYVLELIKKSINVSEIPIIVLSDLEQAPNIDKNQINDFILKPITIEKIQFALKANLLKVKRVPLKSNLDKKTLVLIAEDNENSILMMYDYLKMFDYDLLVARNGNEAVELVQQKFPDIVLMDIQMPGMDGIEATKMIRKNMNKKVSNVPIISLTALAMPDDRQKCYDAGINEYMKKPISLKTLVSKMEELLALKLNK